MFRKLLGACVGLAMMGMAGTVNAALMGRTGWSGRATLRFLICTVLALIPYGQVAEAAVILSADSVSYNAASTTIVFSDFEGIVADDVSLQVTPLVVDGVRYQDLEVGDGLICGRDVCSGNPFDSALVVSNLGRAIDIDVTGIGFSVTAIGGVFGDVNTGPSDANISVFGAGNNLLDVFAVQVLDLGAGLPHSFFGFTVADGSVITRLSFDMVGEFEGVDDMQFGTSVTVPEPPAALLFATGLAVLGVLGWRRRKGAA